VTILTRPRLIGLALAALIFLADQWLKGYVTGPLGLDLDGEQITLLPFFDLTRTSNYGISLGMLTATSMEMRWLLRERKLGDILPLAMVLGGALGNIRDRYRLGHVIDYADLHFGNFRPFLVFNLADAAITIGVVIILARSFLIREKPATDQAASPATET
jgi:signal peptidase II